MELAEPRLHEIGWKEWISLPALGVTRLVAKGDPIAIVGDPMGNVETAVYAVDDGIIISQTDLPLVSEGDAIFHVARYRDRSDDALQAIQALKETFGGGVDEGLLSS